MTDRERWDAIFGYRPFDRLPVYYFGQWAETTERWRREGWREGESIWDATGMDRDWEAGMWDVHGLVRNKVAPLFEGDTVIEESADHRVVRRMDGSVVNERKDGGSIPQVLTHALEPTREAWAAFRKRLDPGDPTRRPADWRERARELNGRSHMTPFLAGSLYGWPRAWMGMERLSLLMYDDPALFESIIAHVADFFMEVNGPVLDECRFDFAYFFEDCCFSNGPMFSPDVYHRHFHKHYRRMVDFYHRKGVKYVLLDSDGKVDALLPSWLGSGIDILFPIEVGTWKADPVALRKRFGRDLRMFGGVNKHVIAEGEAAVRRELRRLEPLVNAGGFVPIPDHRIPPNVSLEAFRAYVRVFKEIYC